MMLDFLYNTIPGRIVLRPLVSPAFSKLGGFLLDTKASKALIPFFVKKSGIDVSDYDLDHINCFNDFFCRPLARGKRRIEMDPSCLVAPCDGLLSVYRIRQDAVVPVKQSAYKMSDLLRSRKLAARYEGGYCLIFRLCVDHFHRYMYAASGKKSATRRIEGVYHTVRPVALRKKPVFVENTREYSLIRSEFLGTLLQMEVGAMLVGRVVNNRPESCTVIRGTEKGRFEYGGSTIILMVEKDRVTLDERVLPYADTDLELPVRMGERIGEVCR